MSFNNLSDLDKQYQNLKLELAELKLIRKKKKFEYEEKTRKAELKQKNWKEKLQNILEWIKNTFIALLIPLAGLATWWLTSNFQKQQADIENNFKHREAIIANTFKEKETFQKFIQQSTQKSEPNTKIAGIWTLSRYWNLDIKDSLDLILLCNTLTAIITYDDDISVSNSAAEVLGNAYNWGTNDTLKKFLCRILYGANKTGKNGCLAVQNQIMGKKLITAGDKYYQILDKVNLTKIPVMGVKIYLEDAVFKFVDFADIDLSNGNLKRTIFELANLRGANFKNADLRYCNFHYAEFANVNFNNANINFSTFKKIKPSGANIWGILADTIYYENALLTENRAIKNLFLDSGAVEMSDENWDFWQRTGRPQPHNWRQWRSDGFPINNQTGIPLEKEIPDLDAAEIKK